VKINVKLNKTLSNDTMQTDWGRRTAITQITLNVKILSQKWRGNQITHKMSIRT